MPDFELRECLDRTFMVQDLFENVLTHDAFESRPELKKLADAASDALAELYQAIGNAMPHEEPKAAE